MIKNVATAEAFRYLRRGIDHASTKYFQKRGEEPPTVDIPVWGVLAVVFTIMSFSLLIGAVEYVLEDVVARLAMVEAPSDSIALAVSKDPDASLKEGLLEEAPASIIIHQKPITSKIKMTLRHLKSIGGRRAWFRGLVPAMVYGSAETMVTMALDGALPAIPGRFILMSIIPPVLLATLHVSWTHRIISMTNKKPFTKLIPPMASFKQLWLPTLVQASAGYAAAFLCLGFIALLQFPAGHSDFSSYGTGAWISLVLRVLAVLFFAVWCTLFIVLPATVTRTRIEASMLPEEDDSVVPFDRTFDGKVIPKSLGGTGAIGFVDAWRTFNWEARRRLIKLYVKITMVILSLAIVMVHVTALVAWVGLGPDARKELARLASNQLPAQ